MPAFHKSYKVESISAKSPYIAKVISIYKQLFPPEERLPVWLLLLRAKSPQIDFLAFIDEQAAVGHDGQGVRDGQDAQAHTPQALCGFAYMVKLKDLVYIFYLAVNPALHSLGHGSAILACIENMNPGCRLVLECEDVQQIAKNSEQRSRRRRFYLQNGYIPNGIKTIEGSINYEMMVKAGACTKEEYAQIMRSFSGFALHLWFRPKFI